MHVLCNVCGQGELRKRTVYRMSGVVVFIGWIFLIPSVLGITASVLIMLAGVGASQQSSREEERSDIQRELAQSGVPQDMVNAVMQGQRLSEEDRHGLSADQQTAVDRAEARLIVARISPAVPAAVGLGGGSCLLITSIVGGLLGWLLTMKKRILKCNACGAVIAAS